MTSKKEKRQEEESFGMELLRASHQRNQRLLTINLFELVAIVLLIIAVIIK